MTEFWANNPETDGQAPGDYGTFNRESWRVLNMHMHKPDGGQLNVSLARPLTWIDAARRDDDGRLWLELAELGITGWATVESLLECPESIDGQGRLVTGTFEHTSGEVVNLFIKGEPDPIGTTAHHRFWSEDRQEFVEAQQLQVGEQLLQADGKLTTVERLVRVEDSQPVYNLEVDGEHVYYVSNSGVLVHNVCAPKRPVLLGRFMETRVKPVARAKGYDWYKAKPRGASKLDLDQWEVNNVRWLKEQIRSGRQILDIGVPNGVVPGRFVTAERKLLNELGYHMKRRGRIKVDDEWFQLFEWVK